MPHPHAPPACVWGRRVEEATHLLQYAFLPHPHACSMNSCPTRMRVGQATHLLQCEFLPHPQSYSHSDAVQSRSALLLVAMWLQCDHFLPRPGGARGGRVRMGLLHPAACGWACSTPPHAGGPAPPHPHAGCAWSRLHTSCSMNCRGASVFVLLY